jgi:TRAP-type C4-dicarboxylate transport system permease small subunit
MLRRLSGLLEWVAAALLLAAVGLNFANVVARYAFGRPIVTAEEILQYANVWIVMLAAAAVTGLNRHLNMDIVLQSAPARVRRALEFGFAALGAGLTLFVLVQGVRIVWEIHGMGQHSIAAGIPLALVYLAIPIGFGVALMFWLQRLWVVARNREPSP